MLALAPASTLYRELLSVVYTDQLSFSDDISLPPAQGAEQYWQRWSTVPLYDDQWRSDKVVAEYSHAAPEVFCYA